MARISTVWRAAVDSQKALSLMVDARLPAELRVDGCQEFTRRIIPSLLRPRTLVYDVGGGRHPVIDVSVKRSLQLTVVGVDYSEGELQAAPDGAYDDVIVGDICAFRGKADGDLVVCRSVLEHVTDSALALAGIASLLKPGGLAALFVPNRHAWYAKLNRILPHRLKVRLLSSLFPHKSPSDMFPARYAGCTPKEIVCAAARQGLEVEQTALFFTSSYFTCCFPLYLIWRLRMLLWRQIDPQVAAETFAVVASKIVPVRAGASS